MIYKPGVTAAEFGIDASNSAGSPLFKVSFSRCIIRPKINHPIASIYPVSPEVCIVSSILSPVQRL